MPKVRSISPAMREESRPPEAGAGAHYMLIRLLPRPLSVDVGQLAFVMELVSDVLLPVDKCRYCAVSFQILI